jgi:hypothetical protein
LPVIPSSVLILPQRSYKAEPRRATVGMNPVL